MLSQKTKKGKKFSVKKIQAVLKYFRSVFFSLAKKEIKLCNAYFNLLLNLDSRFRGNDSVFRLLRQSLRTRLAMTGEYLKKQITEKTKTEITIFQNSKFPLSFKPFHAIQGVFVFAAFLFLAITISTIIFPPPKLETAKLINYQSITTKQLTAAIAGKTNQPIQWTKLVKKLDITSKNYLLQLPKNAKNIKVSTITKQEAITIANAEIPNAQTALTTEDRKTWLTSLPQPRTWLGALSYWFADLEEAATAVVEQVAEQFTPPPADEPPTTETPTAVVVDLSEQIAETAETAETEKSGNQETDVSAVETTIVATTEDSGTSDIPQITDSADVGRLQTPSTPDVEDYVQVTYETPAPTITEQETETGKLVTVSSGNTEKTDCEALNPNKNSTTDQSMVLSPAGLLNGFTNFVKSIIKFFFADLEQAVSEIINDQLSIFNETPIANDQTTADETKDEQDKQEKEIAKEEKQPASAESLGEAKEEKEIVKEEKQEEKEAVEKEQPAEQTVEDAAMSDVADETSDIGETAEPVSRLGGTENLNADAVPVEVGSLRADAEQAYQDCLASQTPITNVLAHTTIPEIYKVGQEDKIKIKWKNNGDQNVAFTAFDLNNNGKIDYVEWTVPHLSDQVFEIIFISKAWHLDSNQEILEDIYDTVATQDNIYATVPQNDFVRVTFEQILDNTKDITIHARPNSQSIGNPTIEVYPVYTDENGIQTQGPLIATFPAIDQEDTYKIYLTNLQTPTDVFDLKIVRGN